MAYERQIPGGPFVNETTANEAQIPGGPFINEGVTGALAVSTGIGALTCSGLAPTLGRTYSALAGVGALTITGAAPIVVLPLFALPGIGALVMSGLAPTVTAIEYEYLHADSTESAAGWTAKDGGSLFASLDENVADDADFIRTATLDSECVIGLEAGVEPAVGGYTYLEVRVPDGFSASDSLQITLYEGVAQVQQWTQAAPSGGTYDLKVTNAITSYADLRVGLKAVAP